MNKEIKAILSIEQRVWLNIILRDFLPLHKGIPDMSRKEQSSCYWKRNELERYIEFVLEKDEYSKIDSIGWLDDLRKFYIEAN